MARGRGGRRGGRGRGAGGGAGSFSSIEARLMTTAATMHTATHMRPKGWWWSQDARNAREDEEYCRDMYRHHIMTVKNLGHSKSSDKRQEKLENLCGQFKSLWSSWWTERDDKYECEMARERFEECQTEWLWSCNKRKEVFERACKAQPVKQSPPPPPRRPSLFTD